MYDFIQLNWTGPLRGRSVNGSPARVTQASGAERCVCSRLYGKGVQHMNFPDQSYDSELLHLMYGALDAAWGDQQQRSWDDIAARARRTAMAFQIMMAVSERGTRSRATEARSLECHGWP
jgi:hypothetical protein